MVEDLMVSDAVLYDTVLRIKLNATHLATHVNHHVHAPVIVVVLIKVQLPSNLAALLHNLILLVPFDAIVDSLSMFEEHLLGLKIEATHWARNAVAIGRILVDQALNFGRGTLLLA